MKIQASYTGVTSHSSGIIEQNDCTVRALANATGMPYALLHNNEVIDAVALHDLVKANRKSKAKGFTYTHHDMRSQDNRAAVQYANNQGFTINLSANSTEHADELKDLNIGPVVTIMPLDCEKVTQTPAGNTIVQCPATYSEITCANCGICQVATRKAIIGFPVHGARKAAAQAIANGVGTGHKVFMLTKAGI